MRAPALIAALLLLSACSSTPVAQGPASPSAGASPLRSPSPSAQTALCRLPIYWSVNNATGSLEVRAAFISIPDGAVSEVGVIPTLPQEGDVTYLAATHQWIGAAREVLSPDGSRYAYWIGNPDRSEVHVVDVATKADRTVYAGSTFYIVIGFEQDGIYLVHVINPRQSVFEKLYRLDPAGGSAPVLVPGSDRQMYQYGWTVLADGAAWGVGVDSVPQSEYPAYSILRLDLATGQVTKWFESAVNQLVWPLGVDLSHRLYLQGSGLWRVDAPMQSTVLPDPGPVSYGDNFGVAPLMVADSHGVWLPDATGIWLYTDTAPPQHYQVGSTGATVAGPCV